MKAKVAVCVLLLLGCEPNFALLCKSLLPRSARSAQWQGSSVARSSSKCGTGTSSRGRSLRASHIEEGKSMIESWLGARLADLEIVPRPAHLTAAVAREKGNMPNFLDMFRSSAPYIRMHRATTMVIHIPGETLELGIFNYLMDEVALISMLGARIVLVVGCRPQVDAMLASRGLPTQKLAGGRRITDPEALSVVKQCAGYMRFEVESALARGRTGDALVQTTGGNFFSAQPVGVRSGIDYGYSGEVRRVETEKIQERLAAGDVVHLTCLGFSPSGQVFNVETEELARICAVKLNASKLIYVTQGEECLWDRSAGHTVLSLRLREAAALLELQRQRAAAADGDWRPPPSPRQQAVVDLIGHCVEALQQGVKRAHLVPPVDGGLIEELYTREGAGMLISRDIYEGISGADPAHLPSIAKILAPLTGEFGWAPVKSTALEQELDAWVVYTKDQKVVGCASLHLYEGDESLAARGATSVAEVGHLAVMEAYRAQGIGRALLGYLERMAIARGVERLLALTSGGGQWLVERGFTIAKPDEALPAAFATRRAASQNGGRVYVKRLQGVRGIDADELLWDIGGADAPRKK
ncbi:amino-acid N-acetyltransferase [Tribonema minus]|uniref:amino-acid N-acetyltransferase n=1 Tax=Tribonema minus TaxID=303371 RepID=A0A836CM49_9STRA|nr:amino-acid N-acetyltransferase [Tribonema minus]